MELKIKVISIIRKETIKGERVSILFENSISSMMSPDHILAKKVGVGYILTVKGFIKTTIADGGEKVFLNLNINEVLKIELPKLDPKFDALPDLDHPMAVSKVDNSITQVTGEFKKF